MKIVSGAALAQPPASWLPVPQAPGPADPGPSPVGGGLEGRGANPAMSPRPLHVLLSFPAESRSPEMTWRERNGEGGGSLSDF